MTKGTIGAYVIALIALAVGFAGFPQSNDLGGLSERDVKAVTLRVTDDATLDEDLVLNKAGFCIDFYATSTATRTKITASSTATIEGIDGVMMFGYGSCQS